MSNVNETNQPPSTSPSPSMTPTPHHPTPISTPKGQDKLARNNIVGTDSTSGTKIQGWKGFSFALHNPGLGVGLPNTNTASAAFIHTQATNASANGNANASGYGYGAMAARGAWVDGVELGVLSHKELERAKRSYQELQRSLSMWEKSGNAAGHVTDDSNGNGNANGNANEISGGTEGSMNNNNGGVSEEQFCELEARLLHGDGSDTQNGDLDAMMGGEINDVPIATAILETSNVTMTVDGEPTAHNMNAFMSSEQCQQHQRSPSTFSLQSSCSNKLSETRTMYIQTQIRKIQALTRQNAQLKSIQLHAKQVSLTFQQQMDHIETLMGENLELRARIEKTEEEYRTRALNVAEHIHKLSQANHSLHNDVEFSRNKIQELVTQVRALEGIQAENIKLLARAEQAEASLKEALQQAEASNHLKDQLMLLESRLQESQDQIEYLQSKAAQVDALTQVNAELLARDEAHAKSVATASEEINVIKDLVTQRLKSEQKWEARALQAESRIQELKQEIQQARLRATENRQLKTRLKELEDELENLKEESHVKMEQASNEQSRASKAEEEVARLASHLKQMDHISDELTSQLERSDLQLAEMSEQLRHMNDVNTLNHELTLRAEKAESEASQLLVQLEKMDHVSDQLTSHVMYLEEEVSRLTAQQEYSLEQHETRNEYKARAERAERQVIEIAEQLDEVRQHISAHEDSKQQALRDRMEIDSLKEQHFKELEDYQREKQQVQLRLEEAERKVLELSLEMNTLNASSSSQAEKIAELESANSKLQGESLEAEEEASRLTSQLQRLFVLEESNKDMKMRWELADHQVRLLSRQLEQVEAVMEENDRLKQRLDGAEQEARSLSSQLEQQEILHRNRMEILEAEVEKAAHKDGISAVNADRVQFLEAERTRLLQDNIALKKAALKVRHDAKLNEHSLQTESAQVKRLSRRVSELEQRTTRAELEKCSLESELEIYRILMTTSKMSIESHNLIASDKKLVIPAFPLNERSLNPLCDNNSSNSSLSKSNSNTSLVGAAGPAAAAAASVPNHRPVM